jgi:2-methylcitrate dehydratase PrpD
VSDTPLTRLAEFSAGVRYENIPEAVQRSIRERILDTAGLCLASTRLETSEMARRTAKAWGGPEHASVFGFGDRLPAAGAAFVNGVLAHSLDFDDTHLPSVLHPSASIVPAALALGEATGASTHEVIAAAAAGYEICIRTGMAAYDRELGNSVFFERGWHATSICGALACATVGAKLFGLSAEGIGHAIGIACSMGAGIIEANRAGGSVKRLHCGWAAHSGVVAAQLAREGITGPVSALEGRFGFYQAYCGGTFFENEITDGLGEDWSIPDVFYKPYPANHFTHAGIDAALALREKVAIEDIETIELGIAKPTMRTIAEPREQKIRPQSGYHGQFSGPFTVAAAIIGGGGLGVYLNDFTDDNVKDPKYLDLAAKVHVYEDEECNRIFPNQFPAVLRIHTGSGTVLEKRVLANRGGPGNPLSVDELRIKFMANAQRAISEERARALAEEILDAEPKPVSHLIG